MDNQKLQIAFNFLRQGQAQQGMNLLQEELSNNPNDWNIHYHIGLAWRQIGNMDKAISSYKRAIQLCPESENDMNFYGLGIAYQLQGDFDNSLDSLKKAYNLNKNSVAILNSLGLTYKKKDDIQKAIEIYNHAAQVLMSNIFEELKKEGQDVLDKVPDDEKAAIVNMEVFNLVPAKLKQDNLYCILQNNLGTCYAELGQYDEARKAYSEAIAFTPDGMNYQDPIMALRQLDHE